jgi:hypothetical protein
MGSGRKANKVYSPSPQLQNKNWKEIYQMLMTKSLQGFVSEVPPPSTPNRMDQRIHQASTKQSILLVVCLAYSSILKISLKETDVIN